MRGVCRECAEGCVIKVCVFTVCSHISLAWYAVTASQHDKPLRVAWSSMKGDQQTQADTEQRGERERAQAAGEKGQTCASHCIDVKRRSLLFSFSSLSEKQLTCVR